MLNFSFTTQQTAQIGTFRFILDGSAKHLLTVLQKEHIYNPCIVQLQNHDIDISCYHSIYKSNKPRVEQPLTDFVVGTAARKNLYKKRCRKKQTGNLGRNHRLKLKEASYLATIHK